MQARGVTLAEADQVLAGDLTGVTWPLLAAILSSCGALQADIQVAHDLFDQLQQRTPPPAGVTDPDLRPQPDPALDPAVEGWVQGWRPSSAPRGSFSTSRTGTASAEDPIEAGLEEETGRVAPPVNFAAEPWPTCGETTPANRASTAPSETTSETTASLGGEHGPGDDHADTSDATLSGPVGQPPTAGSGPANSTTTRGTTAPPVPEAATNPKEFVALMDQYRTYRDRSLREIEREARRHPQVERPYSFASYSTIGKNGKLPRQLLVIAFIAGCGGSRSYIDRWVEVHRRLSLEQVDSPWSPGSPET
ncbi:hypothetical protein ACFOY4_41335 [Actinomadura syzygii]|uniref:Uncharacterized protein n=1 Tax=Actinomadura syzygii TaxID=1427538 RepID=A0A5D0TQK9_9ACTN|nr:hypothetical protein [Actinomadura syzygii]TYC07572.1 hypothetical protein FXF65_41940 [Actinomadura syzygii]